MTGLLDALLSPIAAVPPVEVSRAERGAPLDAASIREAEAASGLALGDDLRALYGVADGVDLAWQAPLTGSEIARYFEADDAISGAVHLRPLSRLFEDTVAARADALMLDEDAVAGLHVLDAPTDRLLVAVPAADGDLGGAPVLILPAREPVPLCASVRDYVGALGASRGVRNWQRLLAEPDGTTPAHLGARHYIGSLLGADALDTLRARSAA